MPGGRVKRRAAAGRGGKGGEEEEKRRARREKEGKRAAAPSFGRVEGVYLNTFQEAWQARHWAVISFRAPRTFL